MRGLQAPVGRSGDLGGRGPAAARTPFAGLSLGWVGEAVRERCAGVGLVGKSKMGDLSSVEAGEREGKAGCVRAQDGMAF
jgi:hypothetical protein